jgi:hypothetical protein
VKTSLQEPDAAIQRALVDRYGPEEIKAFVAEYESTLPTLGERRLEALKIEVDRLLLEGRAASARAAVRILRPTVSAERQKQLAKAIKHYRGDKKGFISDTASPIG